MKEGDVVLATLVQADGTLKRRPALVLREMPPYRDVLVCGISTQLHHLVPDFDEVIETMDDDFDQSSLLRASLIRLGYLAVLPRNAIPGVIGTISRTRLRRLLKRLSTYRLQSVGTDEP